MRSFGLWYKGVSVVENINKNENENKNIKKVEPIFDIHINFWSESVKKDGKVPNLDVGIKIKNFRVIDELVFHCPFIIVKSEVKDLVPKLYNRDNANLIFNVNGNVVTKESYYIYNLEKKENNEKMLLFPLNQDLGEIYYLNEVDNKTDIIFNFTKFNEYINNKKIDLNGIDYAYIRFRISSDELKNSIYFDSEPSNKSFDSAFSGTRIFDFKINEERNLGKKTIAKIASEKYDFPEIAKFHLLIMEPSSYDVQSFTEKSMTCRELEGELWNDYFDSNIESSKSRILAYHWKFENEYSYSCLVKVKYSKTNLLILIAYIFMVLALGIFSSTIVAFTQSGCINYFPHITLSVGFAFGALGLFLGRKK